MNKCRKPKKFYTIPYSLCAIFLIVIILTSGCATNQQAVDLYVDAVMLKELNEREGLTVVVATHDRGLEDRFGRIVRLEDGSVIG